MPALFVATLLLCTATSTASLQLSIFAPGQPKPSPQTILNFNPPPTPAHRKVRRRIRRAFFICPKDETMLRVPAPKPGATFHIPVDGTEMTPGIGPKREFFLLE